MANAADTPATAAVIGAGAIGLVTLKNLREQGYAATAFEREAHVGGLWHFSADAKTTSALPTTVTNISKERGCFTDFPFPADVDSLVPSAAVDAYLQAYADAFGLRAHIRLGTAVRRVTRAGAQWCLHLDDAQHEQVLVDKLVLATGSNATPWMPPLANAASFEGPVLHSQQFKDPAAFSGQRVLVVGLGSTAADTAVALAGHASAVYLSHRHGATILPRRIRGRPIDHGLTYVMLQVQGVLERVCPGLVEWLFDRTGGAMQDGAFPAIAAHPEWRLGPRPSLAQTFPTVSDELVPCLERGDVVSVCGVRAVTGPRSVALDVPNDGLGGPAELDDIDAIVYCTGYSSTLGADLLPDDACPVAAYPGATTDAAIASTPRKPYVRLYQQLFSLAYPDSLAFMGAAAFPTPAFQLYDVASMAVARVWRGAHSLPSHLDMDAWADANARYVQHYARRGSVYAGKTPQGRWLAWADCAAGTGVQANLGWTWAGWRLWLTDRTFYRTLTRGVYSPHLYRLFASPGPGPGRPTWDGARAAIEAMNADVRASDKKTV